MDICTIVAKNYVSYARVLAHSFRAHHPDGRCFVLVIDDAHGYIDAAQEPFELVTIDMLDIEHFERMAALYHVLELSTAVKPWLLRYLLGPAGCERLAYLDPDIRVYTPLSEVHELLGEHRVVVTPHVTDPMPRDGLKPSETDILISGAYNLGFIGLSRGADTDHLIDWWAERLERDCVVAPERGYFVDQRWIDFAPGLVESFQVLRDPAYNVAYWNVWGRELRETSDGVTVNGRPLRFFHFSGYDPRDPDRLSKHQNRVSLVDSLPLRRLCDGYGEALLANGFDDSIGWPYTYDELPGGIALDAPMRSLYREAETAGLDMDPFSEDGAAEFIAWLNEPAELGGHAGVTRYLRALRDSRHDLADHFRDLSGPDGRRFAEWARMFGRTEIPIPEPLVPAEPGTDLATVPGELPASSFRTGVNVAAYFHSVLGVGEVGRQVVSALETQEFPFSLVGLSTAVAPQGERFDRQFSDDAPFPSNLICVNADAIQGFLEEMGADFRKDRYSIGLWWWEVSKFPERWFQSFNYVDEIWACTRHIADALAPSSPVPVVKVTLPVAAPAIETRTREQLGLPKGFLYLFVFDYKSVFRRKNPLAVVQAFSQAFEPGSGAKLVLKSINHEQDEENHAKLVAAAAEHPDIELIDRLVPREDKDAMIAACDCYVSLHRSEGFGLTLAEAMHLAKPVIATAYSGNLDFMTAQNSYLVDHELVPVGPHAEPYPADAEWAEPDVDHAAELMRRVFDRQDEARARGERAQADIRRTHSPEIAGKEMVERLLRVQLRPWAGRNAKAHSLPRSLNAEWLYGKVNAGPSTGGPRSRLAPLKRLARKLVLRLMKPYTVHQREVNRELVMALDRLDLGLHGMAQSVVARIDSQGESLQRQIDERFAELQPRIEETDRFMRSFGFGGGGIQAPTTDLGPYPEPAEEPWTADYVERHAAFMASALDDHKLLSLFRHGQPLPEGYGVGYDERVVELPWLFTRDLHGRMLDAGSVLNHAHTVVRARHRVDELTIVTLSPEPEAYPFLGISYLYADLRELPLRDASQDLVACISTLEHVGMDNSQYGAGKEQAEDPDAEVTLALGELRRVLRPGGELLVSVPFGVPEEFGWVRVFDAAGLEALQQAFGARAEAVDLFLYEASGWRRATMDEAAGAEYRDHYSSSSRAPDRAAAARAVACLSFRKQ